MWIALCAHRKYFLFSLLRVFIMYGWKTFYLFYSILYKHTYMFSYSLVGNTNASCIKESLFCFTIERIVTSFSFILISDIWVFLVFKHFSFAIYSDYMIFKQNYVYIETWWYVLYMYDVYILAKKAIKSIGLNKNPLFLKKTIKSKCFFFFLCTKGRNVFLLFLHFSHHRLLLNVLFLL